MDVAGILIDHSVLSRSTVLKHAKNEILIISNRKFKHGINTIGAKIFDRVRGDCEIEFLPRFFCFQ